MNRIVREHYPVANLPEDLRAEFGLTETVTVTVTAESDTSNRRHAMSRAARDLLAARRMLPSSANDSVARVSSLRDEWDDRLAE